MLAVFIIDFFVVFLSILWGEENIGVTIGGIVWGIAVFGGLLVFIYDQKKKIKTLKNDRAKKKIKLEEEHIKV